MGLEPGGLFGGELGGAFAEVADGFQGELARDGVGVVVGDGLECRGPAIGGVEDLGESLAQVGVAGAVVVEVVGEFVDDGGELAEQIAGVFFAAGAAGLGVEVLDLLEAQVVEFDEEEDAIAGEVAGLADLVDFAVGEGGRGDLGAQGRGEARMRARRARRVRRLGRRYGRDDGGIILGGTSLWPGRWRGTLYRGRRQRQQQIPPLRCGMTNTETGMTNQRSHGMTPRDIQHFLFPFQ